MGNVPDIVKSSGLLQSSTETRKGGSSEEQPMRRRLPSPGDNHEIWQQFKPGATVDVVGNMRLHKDHLTSSRPPGYVQSGTPRAATAKASQAENATKQVVDIRQAVTDIYEGLKDGELRWKSGYSQPDPERAYAAIARLATLDEAGFQQANGLMQGMTASTPFLKKVLGIGSAKPGVDIRTFLRANLNDQQFAYVQTLAAGERYESATAGLRMVLSGPVLMTSSQSTYHFTGPGTGYYSHGDLEPGNRVADTAKRCLGQLRPEEFGYFEREYKRSTSGMDMLDGFRKAGVSETDLVVLQEKINALRNG